MTKFSIGDVLYIQSNMYFEDAIMIVTNITSTPNKLDSYNESSDTTYYHIKTLDGERFSWFMEYSPYAKHCKLMVRNLNEAERLAMIL